MCEHDQNVTPLTQHTHTHTKGKNLKKRIKSNRLSLLCGVNLKRIKEKTTRKGESPPPSSIYSAGLCGIEREDK